MMKFEIPFNVDSDYQEKLFLLKFTFGKKIKSSWTNMIISSIVLLLLLFVQKNEIGYILTLAFFIGVIMISIYYLVHAEKVKRKYIGNIKSRALTLIDTMVVYEFNEDFFEYSDKYLNYKIAWSEFQNFISSPNILLMKQKYNDSYSFVISKHEFGETEYLKVMEFLKEKMPQKLF